MSRTFARNDGERFLFAYFRTLDEAGKTALIECLEQIRDGENVYESLADFARVIGRHDMADLFLRRPS